jgi:Acetyltransferase (GNAT) domain
LSTEGGTNRGTPPTTPEPPASRPPVGPHSTAPAATPNGATPVGRIADAPSPARLAEWDDLVRSVPHSDVAQLSVWARLREQAGYRAVYVFAENGEGRLAGGAQVLTRRVPGLGTIGYLAHGPLVSPAAVDPATVDSALVGSIAHLGRRRFRLLVVQPPDGAERTSRALLDQGFRRSDAGIGPTATLRIDLSVDEHELRRNLSKSLRRQTNRWDAQGVTVRRSTDADMEVLAHLLAATSRRQGSSPLFGARYLATLHRELARDGHLVGFIGEAGGRPVAMLLLTGCGDVLKGRFVGFESAEDVDRLSVPAAVDWAAIRWAKAHGYRWYDFGGVRDESLPLLLGGGQESRASLPGPDLYKVRFGGQLHMAPPAVELIHPAVVRGAYDIVRRSPGGRAALAQAKRVARAGIRATAAQWLRHSRSSAGGAAGG